ncbi:MAG: hypothetical protein Q7S16_05125 [bacterium]|nr:hypothetical protein [bacterium]
MRNLLSFGFCIFAVIFALSTTSRHESTPIIPERNNAAQKEQTIVVLSTAYCPCELCCGDSADGETSIGDDAFVIDGVAADPRALPYRTRISIPSIGVREVDDTGGALRRAWRERGQYHIDLRFATHDEALEWGRQIVTVTILSH